jgi:acetylornithine deacetylase/succinyl-diaminopimelate desuccinylase-like protein
MPERAELERRTTELLQKLIRFNTVNPPGNEEEVQRYLESLLSSAGLECELLAADEGRPNLVATLSAASDGPTLGYLGHVDTVLADPDDWSVDPWSGELRDDCVWGRGAIDMKSQVAAEVSAVVALAEEGWRPEAGELKLVLTADEEAGGSYGAQWLCEQHADKVRCDLIVNEGAGEMFEFDGRRLYSVCVAEKGVVRFDLTTRGRAGHASMPRIGDNALTKLAPVLEALADGRPSYELSPEPEAMIEAMGLDPSDLEGTIRQVEEKDPRLAVLLEPMLGVTLTPTMVSASQKVNVIPARAELRVDCRVPPGYGEEHALKRIRELLGDNGYDVEFGPSVVGNRSPIDSPLMDSIKSFIEREDPEAHVAPFMMPGFSDSRWFRQAFPDCVAYGFFPQNAMDVFESAQLMHGADERVPVSDLGLAATFYANLAVETLR